MFQFPGFASTGLCIQPADDWASPQPGSPIRISTDQRSLAAPRGFSQLATSFIAVLCLGIHLAPLMLDPFYLPTTKIASLRPLGTPLLPLTPICQKAARPFRGGPDNLAYGPAIRQRLFGPQNTIPKPSALLDPSVSPNRRSQLSVKRISSPMSVSKRTFVSGPLIPMSRANRGEM